jgi:hypothetical protein
MILTNETEEEGVKPKICSGRVFSPELGSCVVIHATSSEVEKSAQA